MKTMILAAGRGERMRPLTDHTPKPLLPVAGKPLIVWHIERLAAAGFTELVINHAHLGAQIESALGNGSQWGVCIAYSPEAEALETAGGIAQAMPSLGAAPFMVINGDVFCDLDLAAFARRGAAAIAAGDLAWLALITNPEHNPKGDFALRADRIVRGATDYTFAGIGVYHPAMFASTPRGAKAKLAPLLFAARDAGKLGGEHFTGRWVDVGTPQRLAELDAALQSVSH